MMMLDNVFSSLALCHYQTMIPAEMVVITGMSELHTARSHTQVVKMVNDLIVVGMIQQAAGTGAAGVRG